MGIHASNCEGGANELAINRSVHTASPAARYRSDDSVLVAHQLPRSL